MAASPLSAAQCNGVKAFPSGALTSARWARSTFKTASWPFHTARCNGVNPFAGYGPMGLPIAVFKPMQQAGAEVDRQNHEYNVQEKLHLILQHPSRV